MRQPVPPFAPVLALLALAACTSLEEVSPRATITCGSASDCPGGRVCNRGRCVNPDAIDTTPPDLVAGSVVVAPARVRVGQAFTVTLQVTEPLEAAPTVALGLVPPIALECAATSAVAFACTHTASGHENDDLGGDVAVDVRMRDVAGNDTVRSSVAAVSFDFAPPSPTLASVAYDPAPSNPLASVTMATTGTRVRVALSADERLSGAAAPSLVARRGADTLTFALTSGGLADVDAVFAATVGAQPDGDYALEVAWTDEVGNLGTATVPGVAVKVKTSRPTLTVDQAAVVFVRSPWGNASPEDLGGYTIPPGAYFALEPADPLSPATHLPAGTFLLDGGVVPERLQVRAGTMTVGTLRPRADGTWPRQALASPDTFTVEVVGYDDAGNGSAPRAIDAVEWVATSNLPPTGTTPHTLRRTPLVEASRVQRTEVDTVREADVAGADGAAAVAVAEGVWRKMTFAPPPGRVVEYAALTYDAARGRPVMFGGRLSSSVLRTTSEWDGRAWVDVTPPSGSPEARFNAALAYDGARERVVLFGGEQDGDGWSNVVLQDTWEWDGVRWVERTPVASPPPRTETAMAYDSARRRVVLFGGRDEAYVPLGDTWEWDGSTWTSIAPAGGGPEPRYGHGLAYDPRRGRTVLVGAGRRTPVWEWDGSAWTSITPAPAGAAVDGVALAYDPALVVTGEPTPGRIVLFGTGVAGAATPQAVFAWDGASWTTVAVPAAAPAVYRNAVAHDVARGRTLIHNGPYTPSPGTWEWDGECNRRGPWERDRECERRVARGEAGGSWRNVTPKGTKPGPGYMYANALAYDSGRRRTVLWGVSGPSPKDTWEWDGANWTSVAAAAAGPGASSGLVHDPARGRTIATSSTQTWEWDGTSWRAFTPASQPTGRLVYDGTRSMTMAIAWTLAWWNGSTWTTSTPGLGADVSGLAVFDSVRSRVVAWNERGTDRVWEWDGSAWTTVAPGPTAPSGRSSTAVSFDSERGRTVLFGGMGCGSVCQDTWEWDGARWRDVTPTGTKPPARRFHSMTYDSHRHRTVLFSGNDVGGDIYWDDTWELEARNGTRPAVQLDVSAARTGITPQNVRQARVRARAGGAFAVADPGASGGAGATLRAWATHSPEHGAGGWVPLATNDAPATATLPYLGPPATTLLAWDGDAAAARRLITERDGELSFQVVPSGTMGPDPGGARVALDYIEVRIRYAAVP